MPLMPMEGSPGLFRDDQGNIANIRDYRESDIYDSVVIPAANVLVAGSEWVFFQDVQGKREIDSNFKTPRKMAAGESMVVDRIGLQIRLSLGNAITKIEDIKKVAENGFFRIKVNDLMVDSGPMIKFPSGFGLSGQTNESDAGIASIGVPATASANRLMRKLVLNQNHELDAVIRFDARTWVGAIGTLGVAGPTIAQPTLSGPVMVTCYLHGLIRSAVTK